MLRILSLVKNLKVGFRRAVLERDWIHDGGLQGPGNSRYVLQSCRYIKINVEFYLADSKEPFGNPDDIILKISTPHLEPQFMD